MSNDNTDTRFTRRTVIGMLGASAGAGAIANALPLASTSLPAVAAAPVAAPVQEVVSFFMDTPYIDKTGTAIPYIPSAGYGRENLYAALPDDAALWMYHC